MLTAVRAFYLDLAEWADDDPARWAAVGGALPGQRQRRLAQEGPLPAQVPDGPTHPGTAAGAARAGLLGRDAERARTAELLAAAEATRPGELFTAAGADAAPHGHEDRDHRPHLGRAPSTAGDAAT